MLVDTSVQHSETYRHLHARLQLLDGHQWDATDVLDYPPQPRRWRSAGSSLLAQRLNRLSEETLLKKDRCRIKLTRGLRLA